MYGLQNMILYQKTAAAIPKVCLPKSYNCVSQSSNKLQNSYLQNVHDWAKIILKHSQREDTLVVDAQHRALGAINFAFFGQTRRLWAFPQKLCSVPKRREIWGLCQTAMITCDLRFQHSGVLIAQHWEIA